MLKEIIKYKFFKTDVVVPFLIFFVTSRCNFRCPNCFNLKNLDNGKGDLTISEIEKMAPTLGRLLWLALSGGEPFLRDDLPELVSLLYKYTHFRRLNLPTNGYMTDRIVRTTEKMLPGIRCDFGVAVSIDGIGKDNDELKGVPGSFEAAGNTVAELKKMQAKYPHLSVKINTVVSQKNMDKLHEFAEYVYKNFAPDFHAFEIVRAQPKDSPIQPPSPEQCVAIYKGIRDIWKQYKQYEKSQSLLTNFLAKGLYKYLHHVHVTSMKEERQAIPCLAGQITAVIYEKGNTALCEMLPSIGNLRDNDMNFSNIWKSQAADKQRTMIRAGGCHCTHTCFQFPSVLFNPSLYYRIIFN